MFKTVLTLFRGSVAAAGEELEDRSALLILDQQMRDAASAVERSKRTLALAIAQDQQEGRRLDATNARIADLGPDAIVFELTGPPEDVDSFEELVRPHGLQELVRTGRIGLPRATRGPKGKTPVQALV